MASSSTPPSPAGPTATTTASTTATTTFDPCAHRDPLPPNVRPYDHILLDFADGRKLLVQAIPDVVDRSSSPSPSPSGDNNNVVATDRNHNRSKYPPCKINKRTYHTAVLVGLPYGTVLEVGKEFLMPLMEGEDLLPDFDEFGLETSGDNDHDHDDDDDNDDDDDDEEDDGDGDARAKNGDVASSSSAKGDVVVSRCAAAAAADNRDLVDDNTSQELTYEGVRRLMASPSTTGADVVAALVRGSSTYVDKTVFSKAKYVRRKQLKYQMRCRVVRVSPSSLCAALHMKDLRRMGNLREDTLGQILGYANISAGRRVMVMDGAALGIVTAGCVRRMAGYGTVYSLFEGSSGMIHPGYCEGVIDKMNLTVMERQSLKWVNFAEVFCDDTIKARRMSSHPKDENTGELIDVERRDRELISWPAPLQPHTRIYASKTLREERKITEFLASRSARFARKLTRHSALELRHMVDECRDRSEGYDHLAVAGFGEDAPRDEEKERRTDRNDDDREKVGNANADKTSSAEADDGSRGKKNGDGYGCDSPRQCDSLIIATKYDPTATLFRLLPYLAPSCPFVIYHEFLEPLLHTFHALQNYYVPGGGGGNNNDVDDDDGDDNDDGGNNENPDDVAAVASTSTSTDATRRKKETTTPMMLRHNIAINLRLTDTWFREYQVLEGRTHPKMTMSQNGGYLLTGTKLCPRTGTNELDENAMRELRAKLGGRRRQLTRLQKKNKGGGGVGGGKRKAADATGDGCERKKR